jgi:hypothetical protein
VVRVKKRIRDDGVPLVLRKLSEEVGHAVISPALVCEYGVCETIWTLRGGDFMIRIEPTDADRAALQHKLGDIQDTDVIVGDVENANAAGATTGTLAMVPVVVAIYGPVVAVYGPGDPPPIAVFTYVGSNVQVFVVGS